jgi:DNA polymerase III subunit delta
MQKTKVPVHIYNGEEDYLIDQQIKTLRGRLAGYEQLDGRKLSLELLSDALCGQSLLGGDKLVVINEARIPSEEQPAVIGLLQTLAPGTAVVFRRPALDGRTRLYKWVAEHGEVAEFKPFAPWEQAQLLQWVRAESRRRGKAIAESGARLLIEISGNDLQLLVNELEKLITYCGDQPEIAEDDVAALASAGEADSFALLGKLRRKELGGALALLQQLVRGGAEPFQLLALIASQYRLLLQIKALPGPTSDPNAIAREIKASPYFVRQCLDGIDRFTLAELKEDLALLLDTNLRLKGGEQPVVLLEMLIAALCAPRGATGRR